MSCEVIEVRPAAQAVVVYADDPAVVEVVAVGPQGPIGPEGPAGGTVLQATAAVALSGHRAVYRAADGLRYASADDLATINVLGVTTGAASPATLATVQINDELIELSWSWTPGAIVWLGLNGALTQTPPSSGAAVEIGVATSATGLLVRPQPSIVLI